MHNNSHFLPSPDSRSLMERLTQNGFHYQAGLTKRYREETSGAYVIISFWTHDNLASLAVMDDGKKCACFSRVSY